MYRKKNSTISFYGIAEFPNVDRLQLTDIVLQRDSFFGYKKKNCTFYELP